VWHGHSANQTINHHRLSTPGILVHRIIMVHRIGPSLKIKTINCSRCRSSIHLLNHSIQSMQLHGCEAVFAKVDWFPPSVLPKTITMALLCCHGIMVRRTLACKQHSNQSINQSMAMPVTPSPIFHGSWSVHCNSSSNCSS
jgi:hypothetical protein